MSIYWKARTLVSGDYRELERNWIEYSNKKVIKKYQGKEVIYCVTRLFSDEGGLFCLFFKALAGIQYSIQHGFVPVIDMQTKENIFVNKHDRKTVNAWEYFFEQPAGVSFADVKNKPNKIIIENPIGPSNLFELLVAEKRITEYWRMLCKKYIRYTQDVKQEIKKYENVFADGDKFLAVLARGTDYLNPGVGHPVQPNIETIVARTKVIMEEHNCNKIFLATEDEIILKALKDAFGDCVYYVEQKRYSGEQKDKLGKLHDYKKDAVAMNVSYLAAMYLLAKCDCFFGGMTTGTAGVYLLGDSFECFEPWYNGTHGVNDSKALDDRKLK